MVFKLQRVKEGYCWYFLTNAEESASVRNYHCSLHPEVFRVSYFHIFHREWGYFLLANSSKETHGGKVGKGREGFLWHKVCGQVNFTPTRLLWARLIPGLLGTSSIRLYAVPRHGGVQGMDKAVITFRLPLNRRTRGKRR
jgi:hypothetical protein